MRQKAIIAMSGGVDSSVAAYLLKKQGYEVIGLSFELWDQRDRRNSNTCCSIETIEIAKDIAKKIGIEHFTVDVRDAFYRYVIENFYTSYIAGTTPNPCILCNKFIKFNFLLKKAEEVGAEVISTGHYARVEKPVLSKVEGTQNPVPYGTGQSTDNNRFLLKKGVDPKKDQSYVLYVMTQKELSKTVFPLGELRKDETRKIARELNLTSVIRPESQEICFIGNGNYVDFIRDFALGIDPRNRSRSVGTTEVSGRPKALKRGPIVNMKGEIIGEHKGIAFYTIGQRKRLGISALRPYYVVDIDTQKNIVIVGSKEDALRKRFKVKELNWISIESLSEPLRAMVKVRSTMKEEPSIIIPDKNQTVIVEFDKPQWAPAPGQSAVFYDGDLVVGGGGIISGF